MCTHAVIFTKAGRVLGQMHFADVSKDASKC